MFLSSISSCRNDKCSKKDSCLRYTTDNNIKIETYLVLTEECNKSKSYINKDEYYKKMIQIKSICQNFVIRYQKYQNNMNQIMR